MASTVRPSPKTGSSESWVHQTAGSPAGSGRRSARTFSPLDALPRGGRDHRGRDLLAEVPQQVVPEVDRRPPRLIQRRVATGHREQARRRGSPQQGPAAEGRWGRASHGEVRAGFRKRAVRGGTGRVHPIAPIRHRLSRLCRSFRLHRLPPADRRPKPAQTPHGPRRSSSRRRATRHGAAPTRLCSPARNLRTRPVGRPPGFPGPRRRPGRTALDRAQPGVPPGGDPHYPEPHPAAGGSRVSGDISPADPRSPSAPAAAAPRSATRPSPRRSASARSGRPGCSRSPAPPRAR